MESMIRDIKLAPGGHDKIEWVKNFMPVMRAVDEEFSKTKPFAGKKMVIGGLADQRRRAVFLNCPFASLHLLGMNRGPIQ